MPHSTITVLVHSPYDILRAGIVSLLASDPECRTVGAVSAIDDAITMTLRLKASVLILDLREPVESLADAIVTIREKTDTRLVGLMGSTDWPSVMMFMNVGVSGFIPETAAEDEIVEVIKRVGIGAEYVSPLFRQHSSIHQKTDAGPLTSRERQIVALVAMGYTGEEIAQQLCISPKTVETHRSRVSRKLGTRTRAQLVRYAVNNGLTATDWGAAQQGAMD